MMNKDRPVMAVALAAHADATAWVAAFRNHLPDFDVAASADITEPDRVRYVAAWKHEAGSLARFRHLGALFSLGAGVDHLLTDPALPARVPIVRAVDPDLTNRMSEWVVLHVLMHHRQHRLYDYQQFEKIWASDPHQPAAKDVRVGVMGLGVLGGDAAAKLKIMGFDVAGWSRTPKSLPGLETFAGADGLGPFLARTQILVCLLPLTPNTGGILDMTLFNQLARDSHFGGPILINAGRGGLQNEADIIQALEDGVLRAATLDVFETEPLPQTSDLWHHPGVTVTPHNAADSNPDAIAGFIAGAILAHQRGEPLPNTVDRKTSY